MPASAATHAVGPGEAYPTLSAVLPDLRDGDRVTIAPGDYADCAVIARNGIIIEGQGDPAATRFEGKSCAGKGILVISGANVTVRNLTLAGARVPDRNGAGIRDESPHLTVERVRFINNENGILSGLPEGQGRLLIRDSVFIGNGGCFPVCAHGIYVGSIALLRVERSRFAETRQGHHIKSRALRTEVLDTSIDDGPGGTASYLIDIPNGGDVLIRGNRMVKGPKAENPTAAIMLGAEGVKHPTRELRIEANRFRNAGAYETSFVANRTATPARLVGNRLEGRVRPLTGEGTVKP